MEIFEKKPGFRYRFRSAAASSLALVCVVIFGFLLIHSNNPAADGSARSSIGPQPADTVKITTIYNGRIMRNSSLYAELLNLELPQQLVGEITSRFSRIFNLKKSQPGDSFKLFMGPDDTVEAFEYVTGDWKRYRLDRDGDRFIESVQNIGLERSVKMVEGSITTTLWDALEPKLPDMDIFFEMADVFGWEIDFLTEPRIGDSFKIVFETFQKDGVFVKSGNILAAEYDLEGIPHRAFLYTDPDGHRDYYDEKGYSLRKELLKSPLNFRRISSKFSYRRFHPIYKIYRPHLGVDYAAAIGTPVVAAGDGFVVFKGVKKGFGNYLEIRHANGLITCYGHLGRFGNGVAGGRRVVQGQVIGYVGNTGESTGPHLDYRIRKNGNYMNPLKLTIPAAMPVKEEYRIDFEKAIAEYKPLIDNPADGELLAHLD